MFRLLLIFSHQCYQVARFVPQQNQSKPFTPSNSANITKTDGWCWTGGDTFGGKRAKSEVERKQEDRFSLLITKWVEVVLGFLFSINEWTRSAFDSLHINANMFHDHFLMTLQGVPKMQTQTFYYSKNRCRFIKAHLFHRTVSLSLKSESFSILSIWPGCLFYPLFFVNEDVCVDSKCSDLPNVSLSLISLSFSSSLYHKGQPGNLPNVMSPKRLFYKQRQAAHSRWDMAAGCEHRIQVRSISTVISGCQLRCFDSLGI